MKIRGRSTCASQHGQPNYQAGLPRWPRLCYCNACMPMSLPSSMCPSDLEHGMQIGGK